MLAVSTRGYPAWLTRMVTSLYSGLGFGGDFAWGMAARDPFLITFDTQLVTSDRARFARAQDFLQDHPDLRLAGPTWGWLEAAYRSMTRVNGAGLRRSDRHAGADLRRGQGPHRAHRCGTRASRRACRAATYLDFADSEHEILMENNSIRARFWAAFDAFMAADGRLKHCRA